MDIKLQLALLTASVTVLGWAINHIFLTHRDRKNQKREALLRYTEKQLEELYGPLAFLIIEGKRTFTDLLEIFGRKHVFLDNQPLSEDEYKTWLFWAENDFLPRNDKIKNLLMNKTHLIEGNEVPDSYIKFLDHCNSWQINHRRWEKENKEYSWRSKIDWPKEFSHDVLETFKSLRERHAALIHELEDDSY